MDKVTIDDFEKELGLVRNTLYAYIKKGKITPYNKNDWHIDGEYLFTQEELDRAKSEFKRPDGYTTREAAKKLGVTPNTINRYINEGKIEADQYHYRGKDQYFLSEEEMERIYEEPRKKKVHKSKKTFVNRQQRLYLFQPFQHKQTGERAIVTNIGTEKNEEVLLTTENSIQQPYRVVKDQYDMLKPFNEGESILKKGWVRFRFPLPENITSRLFTIFDAFVEDIGIKNMDMNIKDNKVELSVKPCLLPSTDKWHKLKDQLEDSLVQGTFRERHNGYYIDSELESLHANVHHSVKEKVQKIAEREGRTLDEVVGSIIEDYVMKPLDDES